MANYSSLSPYYDTPLEGDYLGPLVNRTFPKLKDDIQFQINQTYHLRPDLLAFDLYGDSDLWWVFAQRNPNTLQNPLNDFVVGTVIYLPQASTLKNSLGF